MTENKAISGLKRLFSEHELDLPCTESLEVLHTAIKALEEVQQYREIGTPEEFQENKEFLEFLYNRINPNDMEQYLSMYNGSGEKIN